MVDNICDEHSYNMRCFIKILHLKDILHGLTIISFTCTPNVEVQYIYIYIYMYVYIYIYIYIYIYNIYTFVGATV